MTEALTNTFIDEQGLGDQVLEEYVKSGYNLAATARKFQGITPQDILYYVGIVKSKQPERWENVIRSSEIDVVRKLTGIINKVEKKLDAWELDENKEGKFLMAAREVRDGLRLYVDILEKLFVQRQAIAFRKAILEIIREVDPEAAQTIIQRIKEFSDLSQILGT